MSATKRHNKVLKTKLSSVFQPLTIHFHGQEDGLGSDVGLALPHARGGSHPRGHHAVVVPKVMVLAAVYTQPEFQRADPLHAEVTAAIPPALAHNPSAVQRGQQDGLSVQREGAHGKPGHVEGHIVCGGGQRRIQTCWRVLKSIHSAIPRQKG